MAKYYRPNKRYPKYWHKLRFVVFYRDKFVCQLCGRKTIMHSKCGLGTNCHHITPIRLGGRHDIENLTTLCRRCHEFIHENYIKKRSKKYGK